MSDAATSIDYSAHLRSDAERLASLVEVTPLDRPIAACPDWDLARLVVHLGSVHRWATAAILTAARPAVAPDPPESDAPTLAAWLRDGVELLVAALEATPGDAPTWHPFPRPQVAALWPRRQAQETLVHRVDAELAAGSVTPIDPVLAADGIDEYFETMLPRLVSRDGLDLPTSTLHVHCTDTHGEWIVMADGPTVTMRREHAKGDAALRGPASSLLLALWGRSVEPGSIETIGSTDAAEAWLALGGA